MNYVAEALKHLDEDQDKSGSTTVDSENDTCYRSVLGNVLEKNMEEKILYHGNGIS